MSEEGSNAKKRSWSNSAFQYQCRYWGILLALAFIGPSLIAASPPRALPGEFFGLTNLWTLEIRVTSNEWRQLISSRPEQSASSTSVIRSKRHLDLSYIRANVVIGSETISNVALRVKGSGTRGAPGRVPLKIDFNKIVSGQHFQGISKLSLNNNFYDVSYMRDALSYALFREFNVPAPRTAYAKVYVSFGDRTNRQYLGLYTAAEAVDERFLKRNFGDSAGFLLKPQMGQQMAGLNWRQTSWERTGGTEEQKRRVAAFFTLVETTDDTTFKKDLGSYMDLDEYLRFLVVNVALANLDSYLGMGKNFYLYYDSKTERLKWIPWDLDLSFGGFFLAGTPQERVSLSINRPSTIRDRLIRRVLGVPEWKARYHELMTEFLNKHFERDALFARVDLLGRILEKAVNEEGPGRARDFMPALDGRDRPGGGMKPGSRWVAFDPGIKRFIEGRGDSIRAQLAGTEKGERPGFGQALPW